MTFFSRVLFNRHLLGITLNYVNSAWKFILVQEFFFSVKRLASYKEMIQFIKQHKFKHDAMFIPLDGFEINTLID